MEWRAYMYPRDMFRYRSPAGEKLVGDTSKGRSVGKYLASKVAILKSRTEVYNMYILPTDPLPAVYVFDAGGPAAGARTILLASV